MLQRIFVFLVALALACCVYWSYRAIDTVAGIFDGRTDVQIAEIETGGKVEIARINAQRDVQVTTINAQRDVTTTCIEADYNAFRCIETGGVPGTRQPGLSFLQWVFLGFLGLVSVFGALVLFGGQER